MKADDIQFFLHRRQPPARLSPTGEIKHFEYLVVQPDRQQRFRARSPE